MLDGFAAHTHGLRVLIEPRLRSLDDVFVFPAFDAALVGRCALILERACAARLRQVNPHFLAIFISGEVVRQLLAPRAALNIVLGQIGGHRPSLAQGSDGMGPEIVKSVRHTDSTSTPDFGSSYLSSWNPS